MNNGIIQILKNCNTKIITAYKLRCVSTFGGKTDLFDVVVLTIPTPQILQLKGTVSDILGTITTVAARNLHLTFY